MLQGMQTVLPTGSAVSTVNGSLTQASMVSDLQSMMQAYQIVDDEDVALKEARRSLKASQAGYREEYLRLKAVITAFFGASSPQLAKFGLKPKGKAKPLTVPQKLARTVRANKTREIRGTLGSVAKLGKKYTGPVNITTDLGSTASSAASSSKQTPVAVPAQQPGPVSMAVAAPVSPVAAPVVAHGTTAAVSAPAQAVAPSPAPVVPGAQGGTTPQSA